MTGAAGAQDGIDAGLRDDVGRSSRMAKLVPAEQVEGQAAQQYLQLTREYGAQRALAPPDHPQLLRLRAIAQRLVKFAQIGRAHV